MKVFGFGKVVKIFFSNICNGFLFIKAGDQLLETRDGFGIWDTQSIDITAETDAEFLLFVYHQLIYSGGNTPKINIGNDTVLCKGGGIWLNAAYPKSTYLWNTGSTDSMIYAYSSGKYLVTVTNPCGET